MDPIFDSPVSQTSMVISRFPLTLRSLRSWGMTAVNNMATALVDAVSPRNRAAGQEGQFSRHEDGLSREVGHPETLQATKEMCAYCFGE